MGIPKDFRLTNKKDFALVKNEGKRKVFSNFIFQIRLNIPKSEFFSNELDSKRIGIIAGKRFGNAVERNKGKRIVRQLFLKHKEMLPISCKVVIVLKKDFLKSNYTKIEKEFLAACNSYKK